MLTKRLARYELVKVKDYCCRRSRSFSFDSSSLLSESIPKAYNAAEAEEKTLERWNLRKCKLPESSETFRMVLPPPNITGRLHLGHALTLAIQDVVVRWKTMSGVKVDWIPGFDHAGIATQTLILKKLGLENYKKLSKEKLHDEIEQFAQSNRNKIKSQMKRMGPLINWDSEYYTLDPKHNEVVCEAFMELFESGLIERGDGIVNWSSILQTTVSDIEVVHIDFDGRDKVNIPGRKESVPVGLLFNCVYPILNSDKKVLVSTSRPETIFGDVALAVNPNDLQLSNLVGLQVVNPLNGRILPIIADNRVKIDFGTGVLKVSPAHDKVDFLISKDHNLERINVFNWDGTLNEECGEFKGMDRFEGREKIVDFLESKNYLKVMKEYKGSVGVCSRSGDIIEPKILPHWFLRTKNLSQKFQDAIYNGELTITPQHHQDSLLHSLSASQDWCISRQIDWGHKIPMFHHKDRPEVWVAAFNKMEAVKKLEVKLDINLTESDIVQDPDVLDTWFSSALIPLTLSNWPETNKLEKLSLMETGSDILLFWVWRMCLLSLGLTGELPFNRVALHGLITDSKGRKMSKSKGNVIDPLDIIFGKTMNELLRETEHSFRSGELDENEYALRESEIEKRLPSGFQPSGSDALRYTLLSQDFSSDALFLDLTHVESNRHFCNKIWQAMRFYFHHSKETELRTVEVQIPDVNSLNTFPDRFILACLYEFALDMENSVESWNLHYAAEKIRVFFYQQLCDTYIELVKDSLKSEVNVKEHVKVLRFVFDISLRIAHPFLPFLTDEMWRILTRGKCGLIVENPRPSAKSLSSLANPEIQHVVKQGILIAKEIRSMKSRYGLKKDQVFYVEIPSPLSHTAFGFLGNLVGNQIVFGAPESEEKKTTLSTLFEMEGNHCRVSTLKAEDDPSLMENLLGSLSVFSKTDDRTLMKLQKKLFKMKEKFESMQYQETATEESKEKMRKKVERLETEIQNRLKNPPNISSE